MIRTIRLLSPIELEQLRAHIQVRASAPLPVRPGMPIAVDYEALAVPARQWQMSPSKRRRRFRCHIGITAEQARARKLAGVGEDEWL